MSKLANIRNEIIDARRTVAWICLMSFLIYIDACLRGASLKYLIRTADRQTIQDK